MHTEILKLIAVLIMVISLLFAGIASFKAINTRVIKINQQLDKAYNW